MIIIIIITIIIIIIIIIYKIIIIIIIITIMKNFNRHSFQYKHLQSQGHVKKKTHNQLLIILIVELALRTKWL